MFNKKEYDKQWRQEHKEHRNEYSKQWRKNNPEKARAANEKRKEYIKKYNEEHKEERIKYYKDNEEYFKEMRKIYRITHKEQIEEGRKRDRIKLLNIVSNNNIVCVRCGCNDIRLLEINHKNGGGCKELKNGERVHQFYQSILKGERKTDDLELLCKVCNSWHALELKYGKLPYNISFNKIMVKE